MSGSDMARPHLSLLPRLLLASYTGGSSLKDSLRGPTPLTPRVSVQALVGAFVKEGLVAPAKVCDIYHMLDTSPLTFASIRALYICSAPVLLGRAIPHTCVRGRANTCGSALLLARLDLIPAELSYLLPQQVGDQGLPLLDSDGQPLSSRKI